MKHVQRIGFLAMVGALGSVFASGVWAQQLQSPEEVVLKSLQAANASVQYGEVRKSPIAGVYMVKVQGGPTLYVAADGKHMVVGDVMTIGASGFAPYEDPEALNERKRQLAAIDPAKAITFKPKGETKKVVYVFTDVDCGYCRKLHGQMHEYTENGRKLPGYNDLGIEVRYLAYPRAGETSGSAQKLVNAWCAKDPQDALTKLKNNQSIPTLNCDNPVAAQFRLGAELGVSGTPSIFTLDGQVLPGYMPPADLAQRLGL